MIIKRSQVDGVERGRLLYIVVLEDGALHEAQGSVWYICLAVCLDPLQRNPDEPDDLNICLAISNICNGQWMRQDRFAGELTTSMVRLCSAFCTATACIARLLSGSQHSFSFSSDLSPEIRVESRLQFLALWLGLTTGCLRSVQDASRGVTGNLPSAHAHQICHVLTGSWAVLAESSNRYVRVWRALKHSASQDVKHCLDA